jgi:hypothetical protein
MKNDKTENILSRILPLVFFLVSSCGEEESIIPNPNNLKAFRPGAPIGSFCKSRKECEETNDQPITCGCTGEEEQAQCTPFRGFLTCKSDPLLEQPT